jgi:hypothetical protein
LDWWTPSVRLLGQGTLLESLKKYDKDSIDERVMATIRKDFIADPEFVPVAIRKASSAAEGICKWVRAMDSYDQIAKVRARESGREGIDHVRSPHPFPLPFLFPHRVWPLRRRQ